MASDKMRKPQLTKSVLEMKFMKKTRDRLEKEKDNTQNHENLYSSIITEEMRRATGNYISECSYIFCEDLIEGRLSFKGMNPEIERLMELENKKYELKGEMEKDIPDNILAEKFAKLHSNKRQSSSPSKYAITKKRKYNETITKSKAAN